MQQVRYRAVWYEKAGAIAFGDYNKSIENANLLKIALQYVQDFDSLVITLPKMKK
jgi:dihydroorotase